MEFSFKLKNYNRKKKVLIILKNKLDEIVHNTAIKITPIKLNEERFIISNFENSLTKMINIQNKNIVNNYEFIFKITKNYPKIINMKNVFTQKIVNKIPPGLTNVGQTCFHNATIQLFYRMTDVSNFIIDMKEIYNDKYINSFIELIELMKLSNKPYLDNNQLNNLVITNICPILGNIYKPNSQQDAHELLQKILEFIDNKKTDSKLDPRNSYQIKDTQSLCDTDKELFDTSIICDDYNKALNKILKNFKELVNNYMKNNITIEQIKNYMFFFDMNNEIDRLLNSYNKNYNEIINKIKIYINKKKIEFNEENLTSIHKKCKFDEKNVQITNNYAINIRENETSTMSELLKKIIHFDPKTTFKNCYNILLKKNGNPFNYLFFEEHKLEFNKYIILQLKIFKQKQTGSRIKIQHNIKLADDNDNIYVNNIIYKLIGFIAHSGSFNSGHYISYIKYDNIWYSFNDEHVNKINLNNKKIWEYNINFTPYVILYEKIE